MKSAWKPYKKPAKQVAALPEIIALRKEYFLEAL
jgi:hypothetical protein